MELHVEQTGDGPAIVFAHGFGGSARNFRPQVRALKDDYRVACYDARGHARSPACESGGDIGIATLVADFRDVMSGMGASGAVAVGLSLGAATALHVALEQPERVRGLVLASFPAGRGEAGGFSGSALEFAAALEQRGVEGAGDEFVWGPRSGLDEGAAKMVRQGFLEHSAGGLAAILRGTLANLESPALLATRMQTLAVPTLVIAGELDEPSLRASKQLAESLPQARLEVIGGAGHVVNLAKPAEFNALLVDFLSALPAA